MQPTESSAVLVALRELEEADLTDRKGDTVLPAFAPGLDAARLQRLEEQLGSRLPDDFRSLAAACARIDGLSIEVDLEDFVSRVGQPEMIHPAWPFAHEGCGNFWIADLTPGVGSTGGTRTFYLSHDPPVLVYQGAGAAAFLRELVRLHQTPYQSAIADVLEDCLHEVWEKNPGVVSWQSAMGSDDAELSTFAATLGEDYEFTDLRSADVGMGLSWGRYGPDTIVRRHTAAPIFACAAPRRRPGLLRRLFG